MKMTYSVKAEGKSIYDMLLEELNHKQYYAEDELKVLLHENGLEYNDVYDESRHHRQLLCTVLEVFEALINEITTFRAVETEFTTNKDAYECLERRLQQLSQRIHAIDLKNLYKRCNDKSVHRLAVGNFDFEVKHRLSISDAKTIVANVCNNVAGSEFAFYYPELKDYLLRVEVLKAYTNIPLPAAEDGECWDLVYGTPIFAMITGHNGRPVIFGEHEYDDNRFIDVEQYEKIVAAIDKKIDYIVMRSCAGGKLDGSC